MISVCLNQHRSTGKSSITDQRSLGLVSIGSDNKVTTRADFASLSKEMASASPTGPNSASYSPTNSAQACPTIDSEWEASTKLPPSPNTAICGCMYANLTCVAKSGLSDKDLKQQFDYICDGSLGDYCVGINASASNAVYGAYSMCNATQRLSYAFNQYYFDQTANNPQNNEPCDFSGKAHTVKPPVAPSSCKAVFSQAGTAGTGAVTSAPVATDGSGSGGSSSGGGSSTTSSKGGAGVVTVPAMDFGLLKLAAYLTTAFFVGAGFVMM